MVIYMTVNQVNGRKYIGKDLKNDPSYLGSGKILKQAISKYGKDSFQKLILEHCDSIEYLNEREIFWIAKYNATEDPVFYNIAEGGIGGNTRQGMTAGERKKYYEQISRTKRGRISTYRPSAALRANWSAIRKGRPNKNRGKPAKEIYGENYINPNKGSSVLQSYESDILRLYCVEHKNLKFIAQKYNVFTGTVARFLKNRNIGIQRARGASVPGRRQSRITDPYESDIISDFLIGVKIKDICKKYGFKIGVIETLLRDNNLKRYPKNQLKIWQPFSA